MLSRVASSLFWLGRYVERAENYARFIDVNFNLSIDLPPGVMEQWDPLISATGDRDEYIERYGEEFNRENAVLFLAFDEQNPNSIVSAIQQARENARIVRENIPRETWEELNDLHLYLQKQLQKKIWKQEGSTNCFKKIKNKLQLLNGISYGTIPRTQGWSFTKMGQFLERADKTSRILDVKYHFLLPSVEEVGSPLDFLHWTALLKSVSGYNAYRRIYGKIDPTNIVYYLVLNRYFPRSIFFCLVETEKCLHDISQEPRGFSNKAEKAIGNLRADLEYAEVNDLFSFGLHEYLDQLQDRMNQISTAIDKQYFRIRPNYSPDFQKQH